MMNEPLVEGAGCIVGLALLYYYQVWRPGRIEAKARAAAKRDDSAAPGAPDGTAAPAPEPEPETKPYDAGC